MRKLPGVTTLILIGGLAAYGQTARPEPGAVPPGWRALFNGKNLDGWSVADSGSQPAFTVEDGAIHVKPGNGLLWYTREKIGNATLRIVYRMDNSRGSSGVLIRMPDKRPNRTFAIRDAIEVRIDDRGDDWHVTGVLNSMTKASARAVKAEGEWNTLDITMDRPRIQVKLNGALVSFDEGHTPQSMPETGYIALKPSEDRAVIWIREISVR